MGCRIGVFLRAWGHAAWDLTAVQQYLPFPRSRLSVLGRQSNFRLIHLSECALGSHVFQSVSLHNQADPPPKTIHGKAISSQNTLSAYPSAQMIASQGDRLMTQNSRGLSPSQLIQSTRCLWRLCRCMTVTPVRRPMALGVSVIRSKCRQCAKSKPAQRRQLDSWWPKKVRAFYRYVSVAIRFKPASLSQSNWPNSLRSFGSSQHLSEIFGHQ